MQRQPDYLGNILPAERQEMLSGRYNDDLCPTPTTYMDVTMPSNTTRNPDATLKKIMEVAKNLSATMDDRWIQKNQKRLFVEVCIDWLSHSSFRLPNIIPFESLEKELGGFLKTVDITNRFFLKVRLFPLPTAFVCKQLTIAGAHDNDKYVCLPVGRVKVSTTTLYLAKEEKDCFLIIDQCFRIVEKGTYSSSTAFKTVTDIQLTAETALRGMDAKIAWSYLILHHIATIYEKSGYLEESTVFFADISLYRTDQTERRFKFSFLDSREVLVKLLDGSKIKRVTLRLTVYKKIEQNSYQDVDDLEEYIEESIAKTVALGALIFQTYEDQIACATKKRMIPDEITLSHSFPSYAYQEISRESWGIHTISRTFEILLTTGSPRGYASAVVDLAKKQYPRMLALFGQDMLIGFKLVSTMNKKILHIDFVEHDLLTERYITNFGFFKADGPFYAQYVFSCTDTKRPERLVDEMVRSKNTLTPDYNGNLSPGAESLTSQDKENNNQSMLKLLNGSLKSPSAPEKLNDILKSLRSPRK